MEDDSGAKHRLKPMQAKTPLLISQQISYNARQSIKMEMFSEVKHMMFLDSGKTKLDLIFNKEEFYAGEIAIAQCLLDNSSCKKDIKCLKLKFKREIKWSIRDDKRKDKETLLKKEFPGVAAG
jgi:sporulation-control protein spo0M